MAALRFRLLNIPVRIDAAFVVVAALLTLIAPRSLGLVLTWVVVVVASVLWHELAHAAALRAFGHPPHVHLHGMGGETSLADGGPISPRVDIVVALSGPAAGFLLGGAVWVLARVIGLDDGGSPADVIVRDLTWVNAGWAALNLLPMLPLDGGRVMASSLLAATGGRGQRVALVASIAVGVVVAGASVWAGWWWLAIFTLVLVAGDTVALRTWEPDSDNHDAERALADGFAALGQRAWLAAGNRAREVLGAAAAPRDRADAAQLLIWSLLFEGRMADAVDHMRDLPVESFARPLLHPEVLRAAGGTGAAVELLREAFAARPEPATGAALVRGLLEAGFHDEALSLASGARADAVGTDAGLLVAAALFSTGRLQDAAVVGERCFDRCPHPVVAYNLACTRARQGRPQDALAWLGRALDGGFGEADAIDGDPDLARLRGTPEFEAIRQRARA